MFKRLNICRNYGKWTKRNNGKSSLIKIFIKNWKLQQKKKVPSEFNCKPKQ